MRYYLIRWSPALIMMLLIFLFSARASYELPNFNWADRLVKKSAHMIGYALLAAFYWRALDYKPERRWLAWLLAVSYAVTDEWHQSFAPGRHPSVWDVLLFDNLGALTALWLSVRYRKTTTTRTSSSGRR